MDDVRSVVRDDIEKLGFRKVGIDFIADEKKQPEAVALFEWANPQPNVTGGGSWHYLQIQARSKEPDKARDNCYKIFKALDSGVEEIQFHPPDYIIYRPRHGPTLLSRSENNITVYYYELAVWSNNS